MIPRADGNLYMLCYEGTEDTSNIVEYVVRVDR